MNWNHKTCTECERTMSAADEHRRCQRCRNGGVWRRPAHSHSKQKGREKKPISKAEHRAAVGFLRAAFAGEDTE